MKRPGIHGLLEAWASCGHTDADQVLRSQQALAKQCWAGLCDTKTVAEAALIAFADVLVTTDELSTERDAQGGRLGGMHTELNTT